MAGRKAFAVAAGAFALFVIVGVRYPDGVLRHSTTTTSTEQTHDLLDYRSEHHRSVYVGHAPAPPPHVTTTTFTAPVTVPATVPPPAPISTTTAPPTPLSVADEPDYHTLPDWYVWDAVGGCEQPLQTGEPDPWGDGIGWAGTPRGGYPGSKYPGGLGIYEGAWQDFHALAGVAQTNGAYATPYQQILVARQIRIKFGLSGWTSVPSCTGRL